MSNTALLCLLLLCVATAHISLWHPSVYDKEQYDDDHKDSNKNSDPLDGLTYAQWWWHGNLNYPPKSRPDNVFELPANGEVKAWIAGGRTFTPYGWPERMFPNPESIVEPFAESPYVKYNNIHTTNRSDIAGCTLGIAYKSDRFAVKPEDFVIFSVAHDCPARWLQTFKVPNLPACPNNMCQCAWFWVHKSYGGTDQIYMTPFQCRVTNARSDAKAVDVAKARPPRKCYNPATCTMGPRNPMYWKNLERNNMHEPSWYAPSYSTLYGFPEGAQKDIFVDTNTVNYTPRPVPAAATCNGQTSRLVNTGGQTTLTQNQFMVSPNCQYHAWITGDGKFTVGTSGRQALWDTNVYNQAPQIGGGGWVVSVNGDGTVILKNSGGQQKWVSPMTQNVGTGPFRLELTNDGQLVLFDSTLTNLWESFWSDNREQSWVTPFNPDPTVWQSFKPYGAHTAPSAGSVLVGKDIYGNDYNQVQLSNYQQCQARCQSESQCKAWAFETCGTTCWLKSVATQPIDGGSCRTSGVKG